MTNYEDPRWQKLRLQVFERDNWQCAGCCDASSTLVAHHKKYVGEIWDSPASDLQTLCKQCHEELGKHPKAGVSWTNDKGCRVLVVTHCPICASVHFKHKESHFQCVQCGWSACDNCLLDSCCSVDQLGCAVLFGSHVRRVYLAGKMADGWRDELVTNGDNGWSYANGICSLLDFEEDGSWPVVPGVVNVPKCLPIDFCGPFWNTSLDREGGHGHAGLLDKHAPQMHACGEPENWGARFATMARCRRAINRCDLFFAWIDSMDAFGTLVEIGLAIRCKCSIVLAFSAKGSSADLWFASTLADACFIGSDVNECWDQMWEECRDERRSARDVASILSRYAAPSFSTSS